MVAKFKDFMWRHTSLVPRIKRIQSRLRVDWCRMASPSMITRYLENHPVRKLQIGAGRNLLDGWLNTDLFPSCRSIVFLDATRVFPFEDATFDYALSEHQIEHISYQQGLHMLGETLRVLKPGGKLRIATPDLEVMIELYSPPASDLQKRYIEWVVDRYLPTVGIYSAPFVINNAFKNHGHQFLYDHQTLRQAMQQAGFVNVSNHAMGESDDENLRGIESHHLRIGNEEFIQFETMVLQGERPAG